MVSPELRVFSRRRELSQANDVRKWMITEGVDVAMNRYN